MNSIINGLLGGLSFGVYHAYITDEQIKEHNNLMENKWNDDLKRIENEHQKQMKELNNRLIRIQ